MSVVVRSLARIGLVLPLAIGCAHVPRVSQPWSAPVTGVLAAPPRLDIDAGAGDVRVVMRADADSVRWSLRTSPAACADARITAERLALGRRARHCTVRWDVVMPEVAALRVEASAGDIDVTTTDERAVRLTAGVGDVHVSLGGRAMKLDRAAGAGSRFALGDPDARPRIYATTSVGDIRVALRAPGPVRQ